MLSLLRSLNYIAVCQPMGPDYSDYSIIAVNEAM